MNDGATIAAISTAVSSSGIGIVRMSGPESFVIVDRIYRSKKRKKLSEQSSHTIHYGYIMDKGESVDEVLVMLMRGPHSYTGEDTVEVNCHGGVYVVKRILEVMIENGARPAEPGEFTKRAFLNGRLDLSQAEAVGDLIAAQNQYALQSSISQLKGNIKNEISAIRNKIIYHTAFIETALDDPEHISVDGYGEELRVVVEDIKNRLRRLLETFDNGRMIKEGIRTVILGKPNAGKSSLLNVLLGEERAIVTNIAGTTRDVLEEHLNLNGISLNIMDTAGIRETKDIVEKMGVDKAKQYAEQADLILYVIDSSEELDENDQEIFRLIQGKKAIVLLNKSDLDMRVTKKIVKQAYINVFKNMECTSEESGKSRDVSIKDEFEENMNGVSASDLLINERFYAKIDAFENKDKELNEGTLPIIEISAIKMQGFNELEDILKKMFFAGNISFNDEIHITNVRHKTVLTEALESLEKVTESIDMEMPEDFYSIDLLDAYEKLGNITGETIGEDLVNEIFSKFCMGK